MTWTQARLAIGVAALTAALAGCSGDKKEPPPTDNPKINSFTADETSVARGARVTLSWSAEKASSVTITQMPGGTILDASSMLMGTQLSNAIDASTTFRIVATGEGGKTASAEVMVTVDPNAVGILSFVASDDVVARNGSVTLTWSTSGATTVTIREPSRMDYTVMGAEAASGSLLISPLDRPSYSFVLVATNGTITEMSEPLVVTTQAIPVINAFHAAPLVFSGMSEIITLNYDVSDAMTLELTANGTPVNTPNTMSATITYTANDTTTFLLVARSGAGDVQSTQIVVKTSPESEPNDMYTQATPINGGAVGELSTPTDIDFYSFAVGEGGNVFASVENEDGTCPFTANLTLYDSMGTALVFQGGFACPAIDPLFDDDAANLAAGTYYISVETDDTAGPYTLIVRVGSPACGNSIYETGEQCEDGNNVPGDGCNEVCDIEPDATINFPGGSATLTLEPFSSKIISITVPMDGQSIESITHDVGAMTCTDIDTAQLLFTSAPMFLGVKYGDSMDGPCAAIVFPDDAFATNLTAGTYLIRLDNESFDTAATVEMTVTIHSPACGNGARELTEQCDDGNTTSMDGCAAACTVESQGTVMGPGEQTFSGAIMPATRQDFYQVTLPADGYIRVQTYTPTAPDCDQVSAVQVAVLAADFTVLQTSNNFGGCGAIQPSAEELLTAGTYWVRVTSQDGNPIAGYQVLITALETGCGNRLIEMGESCDDGNTAGMDGCSATCGIEPLGMLTGPPGNQIFMGAIDPADQDDYYSLTLTAPAYVEAHFWAPMTGTCTPTSTDSVLSVLDAATMNEILYNDDFGGTYCSAIVPNSAEDLLPAGAYLIKVHSYMHGSVISQYSLEVRLSEPGCGNGVTEMGETCDDGNMAAMDGCTPACQIEPQGTVTAPARQTFTNAINPGTQVDYYQVNLPTLGYIAVETGAPALGMCAMTDIIVTLLDASLTYVDSSRQFSGCGTLEPTEFDQRPAGLYWVRIESPTQMPIMAYQVRISGQGPGCGNGVLETGEGCDDGNLMNQDGCSAMCVFEGMVTMESEPNNTIMSPDPSGATRGQTVILSGAISPIGDIDVFSFTINNNPGTLLAFTHTSPGDPASCLSPTDTKLYLTDAMGNMLTSNDDDGGMGLCSTIDGGTDMAAANLAPGTYYMEVHHWNESDEIPSYYLSISFQ